jgi:hypothetical protein
MNSYSRFELLLLISAAAAALIAANLATAAIPTVHVVLKFVKAAGKDGPIASLDPASCLSCTVVHDPAFERDNSRETLVELEVPKNRYLELAFTARKGAVRRVILEGADLQFRAEGTRIVALLPPLAQDTVDAGEFATHLVETGVVLRMEHADPARLAGAYADKPLPAVERSAANNLEFAQREAVRELGLGAYVAQEKLGVIEIMGFDTNDPHGHLDAPPHMHMHLRWPYNTGTQIGHFYISPQGLLLEDKVWITRYPIPPRTFPAGQTSTTLDSQGRPVYAQTITPEGWLQLESVHPGEAAQKCLIRPDGPGFDQGANVTCDSHEPISIHVTDDIAAGVVRVASGSIVETLRYDPDTGRLKSPSESPAIPESAVVPTARTSFALPGAK